MVDLTAAEPVVVHLARIALDAVVFRSAFGDAEVFARDHHVGGVGAAGPFLAVGAVAEGRDHGLAGVFVRDGGAHAGAFCHVGRDVQGGGIGAMVLMVVLVGKGSIWGECMFWKAVMRFARKEQNGRWGRLLIVWGKR